MLRYISLAWILIFAWVLQGCKSSSIPADTIILDDPEYSYYRLKMEFKLEKGSSYNHPTFVIWIEDLDGNFIKTLYITNSYARGVFGYKMVGDTAWVSEKGASHQPAALPYWTYRKGVIKDTLLIPTPRHPYVDALTTVTPLTDFELRAGAKQLFDKYRVLLEVNQPWDWNKFWINNKFPDSPAYKHSAQPSLVYAVTIDGSSSAYYLNPIGHGDAKGESGKLFTNISTITTAKDIFRKVMVEIK